jgi:hypothetical protein
MIYRFATLDHRPIAAKAANDKLFAGGPVYGIEVTVPALVGRLVGNPNPQANGGDHPTAAIEAALTVELPDDRVTLATVKPDLDSVGAMAVLEYRRRHEGSFRMLLRADVMARITHIANADKFARSEWRPAALPTGDNPWPGGTRSAGLTRELAAINMTAKNFRASLDERVEAVLRWLLHGEEPALYRDRVEAERQGLIAALEDGSITARTLAGGRIVGVCGANKASLLVGYSLAPVVIAFNSQFRVPGGKPHAKYTVAQFQAGYVDLKAVFAELSELESGWDGTRTIGGSPRRGKASKLAMKQVARVVQAQLLK